MGELLTVASTEEVSLQFQQTNCSYVTRKLILRCCRRKYKTVAKVSLLFVQLSPELCNLQAISARFAVPGVVGI